MSKKITVLGAGSWGTALSCVMARQGHITTLWGRDETTIQEINSSHLNSNYLPKISLDKNIRGTTNFSEAVADSQIILIVTPAQTISHIAEQLKAEKTDASLVLCAKGIDKQTGLLPAQTLSNARPNSLIAALSGPSFSTDVARGLPTAVTLAAENIEDAQTLSHELSDPAFRLYANDDLLGVELGGALKNVIALAIGVCRGMQLGASAEAALIARGFSELNRLATQLGANPQTLTGLSGLGDLVLTCSSTQSRNFSYGVEMGKGNDISNLPLAEGAHTAAIANKIANDNNIECPIIETISKLVARTINSKQAVELLMTRPLKQERI